MIRGSSVELRRLRHLAPLRVESDRRYLQEQNLVEFQSTPGAACRTILADINVGGLITNRSPHFPTYTNTHRFLQPRLWMY